MARAMLLQYPWTTTSPSTTYTKAETCPAPSPCKTFPSTTTTITTPPKTHPST